MAAADPAPILALLAAILAMALALGGAAPARAVAAEEEPLIVVASILPLADFARQVGGERVRVTVLIPPGVNPHVFALRPSQMALLARARLLVLNGLGLEFWAPAVARAVDHPTLRILEAGAGLGSPEVEPEEEGQGHEAAGGGTAAGHDHEARTGLNPHVWLDPVLAMEMVRRIRDALAEVDPAHAAEYQARAERYLEELARLDGEYRVALAGVTQRTFIAFHAGYGYLGRRYGLHQLGIVSGFGEGVEPSPARIAEVIRVVRRIGARAVFAEPQIPVRAARLIAEEAGATVAFLDPLGSTPEATYLETMRGNLRELVSALR